jgi:hypothetical protein
MSVFTAAVYSALANDATLTAMLSLYGGSPAIFTTMPIPEDVELPYIITEGEIGNAPFDTKGIEGREIIRDVRCYAEATGSAVEVEAISERVRAIFHRQALTITGWTNIITIADNILTADEDGVYGRILTIRLIAQED